MKYLFEKGNKINLGRKMHENTKKALLLAHIGRKNSEETKEKMRNSGLGKLWWNDGTKSTMSKERPGENFASGRLKFSKKS